MKSLVTGFVLGATVVALAWWLSAGDPAESQSVAMAQRDERPPARTPRETPRVPETRETPVQPARTPRHRAAEQPADAADAPFPSGEAVLHVGECYVFGESAARPRRDSEDADLVCLEITGSASLRTPHGAHVADLPVAAVGVPSDASAVAALVKDAPPDLPARDVQLGRSTGSQHSGVGLVRAGDGRTFKVNVLEIVSDPDVLRRRVRLAYAEVPVAPGGGLVHTVTGARVDATTLGDLERIFAAGRAIPGSSFTNFLASDAYERLGEMPQELKLKEPKYVVVDEPLSTSIEFSAYSGLVANGGIEASGKVRIRSYTGVAVRGDMAGEIDVQSYAYVHVSGSLTGKLRINSYATVVIDGDLTGEVTCASYTTFLLRGRLLGKLSIQSGGSKFWFQTYMSRGDAEAIAGEGGRSSELHLRSSDTQAGKYEDFQGWQRVFVGDDAWGVIVR